MSIFFVTKLINFIILGRENGSSSSSNARPSKDNYKAHSKAYEGKVKEGKEFNKLGGSGKSLNDGWDNWSDREKARTGGR